MTHDPEHPDSLSEAEEARLVRELEAYGRSVRLRSDLDHRLYAASVDHLDSSPESIPFVSTPSRVMVWSRLARAACVLLAFAVTVQMLMNSESTQPAPGLEAPRMVASESSGVSGLPVDLELDSDRETVLFALLDAGETGQIDGVGELQGSDTYGIAFAPILGTAGFELTDFAEEIQSIQGSMRR